MELCVVTEKINQETYKLQVVSNKFMILLFYLLKPFCSAVIPLCIEQCRMCLVDKDRAATPGAG